MNITAGPAIKEYAAIVGAEVGEVVEWVNNYINKPGLFDAVIKAGLMEPTEKERAESIMTYIKSQIENSVSSRIKREIRERKAA